jgi:hypothetical protein
VKRNHERAFDFYLFIFAGTGACTQGLTLRAFDLNMRPRLGRYWGFRWCRGRVAEGHLLLWSAATTAARWRSKPASQRIAGMAGMEGADLETQRTARTRSEVRGSLKQLTETEGRPWYTRD